MKVCPTCKKKYHEVSALSRTDNVTEICSECGYNEAVEEAKEFLSKFNGYPEVKK